MHTVGRVGCVLGVLGVGRGGCQGQEGHGEGALLGHGGALLGHVPHQREGRGTIKRGSSLRAEARLQAAGSQPTAVAQFSRAAATRAAVEGCPTGTPLHMQP